MNSDELERSLRTEFETYLNSFLAEMRQESTEFQNRIEAEFDRHRTQFDEAFRALSTRFDSTPEFDEAFTSSVGEHLKLARDEGAKIAATAMEEAERLAAPPETAPLPVVKYDSIRDAVNDISSQDSQSAILKSLVQHASEFAPRGAFFVVKNEHFAGWKVFGASDDAERTIREIHFPISSDSLLGRAVMSLSTADAEQASPNDDAFVQPLGFEDADQMAAFPLIARGRGVAALYVDGGSEGGEVNREALETMVRVAGLTVELLASTQAARDENRNMAAADFESARTDHETAAPQSFEDEYQPPAASPTPAVSEAGHSFAESSFGDYQTQRPEHPLVEPAPEYRPASSEPTPADSAGFRSGFSSEVESSTPFAADFERGAGYSEPASAQDFAQSHSFREADQAPAQDFGREFGRDAVSDRDPKADYPFGAPEAREEPVATSEIVQRTEDPEYGRGPEPPAYGFDAAPESAGVGGSPFDRAVEEFRPPGGSTGQAFGSTHEAVVPAPVVAVRQGRLSDRPVDLPIDVPEDERRLHNDARRFARLLVSEIKLYNEKKVLEGRKAHDLYDRLREAIDRSREMYDKRVQPPVAAKFDYFHYELLNSLADGNVERLGPGYPGATV